jgi:hypothetical protein
MLCHWLASHEGFSIKTVTGFFEPVCIIIFKKKNLVKNCYQTIARSGFFLHGWNQRFFYWRIFAKSLPEKYDFEL